MGKVRGPEETGQNDCHVALGASEKDNCIHRGEYRVNKTLNLNRTIRCVLERWLVLIGITDQAQFVTEY